MQKNRIIQGDTIQLLPTFGHEVFDLCITDPPYGTNYGKVANDETLDVYLTSTPLIYNALKQDTWFITYCFPLYIPDVIAKAREAGFQYRWTGMNYYPNMFKQKPWPLGYNRTDMFLLFSKGSPKKTGIIKDVIHIIMDKKNNLTRDFGHPHEKPEKCADKLLKATHRVGGLFLDPFCGTGVFCLYAKRYGMNYVGIDISDEYCEKAMERLKKPLSSGI